MMPESGRAQPADQLQAAQPVTQMPLREAVPLAASYLERLIRHRAVHEDEVDVMRRVCDLLQSSRVAGALLQPGFGPHKRFCPFIYVGRRTTQASANLDCRGA